MDTKEFKKILKLLKVPSAACISAFPGDQISATWSKSGGHAGSKVLQRVREAARAAGFKVASEGTHGTPDGSHMGSGNELVKDGVTVGCASSYGVTAFENHFYIHVTAK